MSQLQSEGLIGEYQDMTYRKIEEELDYLDFLLDQLREDYEGVQAANLRIRKNHVVAALYRKGHDGSQSQPVETVGGG